MQPITREAIIERRQPYIRWTAIFAGALVAGGLWLLLQLLLTGGALSAIEPEEVDHVRSLGIGASVGSMLAPLLAMFAGGLLAGRLAAHFDAKIAGLHGVLVWALTSVVGLVVTTTAIAHLVARPSFDAHVQMASTAPAPGASEFIDSQLRNVNTQLNGANAPTLTRDDIIDASQFAITPQGTIDRGAFIDRIDQKTSLSRPEAEAAVTAFGDHAPDVIAHAARIADHRRKALEAAEDAGCAMLTAGLGLLLCLGAALGGALLSRRFLRAPVEITREPVHHTTAPYPIPSPTEPIPTVDSFGNRNPID